MTLEIRPPRPEEKDAFIRMALASWLDAYDGLLPPDVVDAAPEMIRIAADKRFEEFRVAVTLSGDLLGYYSLGEDDFLWHLYVDPAHYRKGVGRHLLAAAEVEIMARGHSSVSLDVIAENKRAIAFYSACGFHETGVDEDGSVLMVKPLAGMMGSGL